MTLPRQIIPGSFYMITRRCTQRQFLLRPDDETNETFLYCLAEAALRYGIIVILPSVLSNHHHTVIFDPHGTVVEFTEHFHKMFAKAQNCLRHRSENLWSSEAPSNVRLLERADVMEKLVYAATNPVKDGLVERVHHWPGVNGLSALLNRKTLVIRRPRHFFRADGPMPATVTLELTIPAELGDAEAFRAELRQRVADREDQFRAERAREGKGVLGRIAVKRQSWRSCPKSYTPRGGLRPQIAARSVWTRIDALQRCRVFVVAYREARAAMLAGAPIPFPYGTYWLRRFAGVAIAPAPQS